MPATRVDDTDERRLNAEAITQDLSNSRQRVWRQIEDRIREDRIREARVEGQIEGYIEGVRARALGER